MMKSEDKQISLTPFFQRRNTTKAKFAKIKAFNESVNRTALPKLLDKKGPIQGVQSLL